MFALWLGAPLQWSFTRLKCHFNKYSEIHTSAYLWALDICACLGHNTSRSKQMEKKTSCEIFSIFNCVHIDCYEMFSLFLISFIFFFCDLIAFVLSEMCLKLIILIYKFCGSCYSYWSRYEIISQKYNGWHSLNFRHKIKN